MFKKNKKLLIFLLFVNIISLTISGCGNSQEEGAVAKVNDDIITQEEFDENFEITKNVYQRQLGEDSLSQEISDGNTYEDVLKNNLLETLITEKIIAEKLDEMGMMITDEEVDEAIDKYYISQLGGEEQYKEYLENNGFTEEYFRNELKRGLIYEEHRANFFDGKELSEEELKEYFYRNKDSFIKVKASHILVKTKEEGNEVLERLEEEDFHSLVASESLGEDPAFQGGDLGYFTKGSLLDEYKEIENSAFNLEVGKISGLIKTELGYHILLLEDRKDTFEGLKEDIIPALKEEKYVERVLDLRENAEVEIYMDSLSQ